MPRRRQRHKSRDGQKLLAVQQDREVQRSTEMHAEGRWDKEKKKSFGWWQTWVWTYWNFALHMVERQMLPMVLGPAPHLCCGHPTSFLSFLAIFHCRWKWDPVWSVSQSVPITVTLPQVSCELQLPPPSFFCSSAHANTESCQNRYMPESKNYNWQGPCDS